MNDASYDRFGGGYVLLEGTAGKIFAHLRKVGLIGEDVEEILRGKRLDVLDWTLVVYFHFEQKIEVFAELPAEGIVEAVSLMTFQDVRTLDEAMQLLKIK